MATLTENGKPKGNSYMKNFKQFNNTASDAIAASLTTEAKLSLYKKSQKYDISISILEQVYSRGYSIWDDSFGQTPEQFAFDRVNSFVSGGFARELDDDLFEGVGDMFGGARDARGISKHLKKNGYEIKRSKGEHTIWHNPSDPKAGHIAMPNHRGDFPPGTIRSMYSQYNSRQGSMVAEEVTTNSKKPSSRFIGTDSLTKILKKETPGQTNESMTGISGIATSNPARQKPLGLQIKPSLPSMFQQKQQKFGNLPKKPGNNPTFIKDLIQKQSEEVEYDVDGVSKGTKERRKLPLVGRMKDSTPDKTLAKQAAIKTNIIDEERLAIIKRVLNEKSPKKSLESKETKNVVIPVKGATPTVYRPNLNKATPDGTVVSN